MLVNSIRASSLEHFTETILLQISFSVWTWTVNVKNFGRKFEGISFLTCESTEPGAVTQRINKS